METKLSVVKQHMQAGNWQKAISLAARFPRLDRHRDAILNAHTAYIHPHFLSQLGKDVAAAKEEGRLALIDRFGE
ncbi:hypothetical protein [Chitinimonas sp.]|uniref:hypothetical protein n=1 Tax=Chitinimonas sp. TaxID=1934313 RepID=UPI0035B4F483